MKLPIIIFIWSILVAITFIVMMKASDETRQVEQKNQEIINYYEQKNYEL